MQRNKLYLFILSGFLITLSSCDSHNKLLKSTDFDAKYNAAMDSYEKGNFFKSTQLFENLSMYYRGREKAEKISLYYAKSLVGMKDYYTAGYQFQSFVRQYPYSEYAEEALFQSAYCKYIESPSYSLDQALTKEAIVAFNIYMDRYPGSQRSSEASKYIDEMRSKLMKKAYENAYSYYKTMSYLSGYISLREFSYDYPGSIYNDEVIYYMLKSEYEYARKSIKEKQKVRYEQLITDIDKYLIYMTKPNYKKELQKFYEKGKVELAKIEERKK